MGSEGKEKPFHFGRVYCQNENYPDGDLADREIDMIFKAGVRSKIKGFSGNRSGFISFC